MHGANRLASNSLLEGVVFGARAARAMREESRPVVARAEPIQQEFPNTTEAEVRALAWEQCGILRQREGLQKAIACLEEAKEITGQQPARMQFELRNLHLVALLIARCALAREESRGGHYRVDFPESRPEFQKHSWVTKNNDVRFA